MAFDWGGAFKYQVKGNLRSEEGLWKVEVDFYFWIYVTLKKTFPKHFIWEQFPDGIFFSLSLTRIEQICELLFIDFF